MKDPFQSKNPMDDFFFDEEESDESPESPQTPFVFFYEDEESESRPEPSSRGVYDDRPSAGTIILTVIMIVFVIVIFYISLQAIHNSNYVDLNRTPMLPFNDSFQKDFYSIGAQNILADKILVKKNPSHQRGFKYFF